MSERKTFEIIEIEERKFKIKMLPAVESIAVLKELLTRALPLNLLEMAQLSGSTSMSDVSNLIGLDSSKQRVMSVDEFAQFETRLLRSVSVVMGSDDVDILDSVGNYQIEGIEYSLMLTMKLLTKVVSVNYKDFFIEIFTSTGLMEKIGELTKKVANTDI